MSEILLHDLRLTLLWTETLPALFEGKASPGAPLGFVGSPDLYAARFADILHGTPDPDGLAPPWSRSVGNFFWTFYLSGKVPGEISGETAWKNLVPFRGGSAVHVEAPWLPQKGQMLVETFLYPYGIAVAVSARIQESLTVKEAVDKAHELRRTHNLEVYWIGTQTRETSSLDALGRKVLANLRRKVLGVDVAAEANPVPFTIATIVRAEGADSISGALEGSEIHQALQALTTWSPTWRDDTLKSFAEARLSLRNSPLDHVLYATRRGRAVWFPGLYRPSTIRLRSLSCYHRNLLFTSLQVESLTGLVAAADEVLSRREIPSALQAKLARHAAGILGRLYGADSSTYRSQSPRVQMDQNGCVEPINRVRDYFSMELLE
ncbi:MAG TPA: hypothetical protein VLT87_16645 [Thermoanaerobaculia bacterium]|nr:hypothetical protein [Thermoanaerobaculia bacterium]